MTTGDLIVILAAFIIVSVLVIWQGKGFMEEQ